MLPGLVARVQPHEHQHQHQRPGQRLAELFLQKELDHQRYHHHRHAALHRVAHKGRGSHGHQQGNAHRAAFFAAVVVPAQQHQQPKGQGQGIGIKAGRPEHKGQKARAQQKRQRHAAVVVQDTPGQQADQQHRQPDGQHIEHDARVDAGLGVRRDAEQPHQLIPAGEQQCQTQIVVADHIISTPHLRHAVVQKIRQALQHGAHVHDGHLGQQKAQPAQRKAVDRQHRPQQQPEPAAGQLIQQRQSKAGQGEQHRPQHRARRQRGQPVVLPAQHAIQKDPAPDQGKPRRKNAGELFLHSHSPLPYLPVAGAGANPPHRLLDAVFSLLYHITPAKQRKNRECSPLENTPGNSVS